MCCCVGNRVTYGPWALFSFPKDRQIALVTPPGAGSRRLMPSPVIAPKALWASNEAGGANVQDLCRKAPSRGHLA